jgi:hypothetical protein
MSTIRALNVLENSSGLVQVTNTGKNIFVKYHETVVFELERKNNGQPKKITFRTGGWFTRSTQAVIKKSLSQLGIDAHITGRCQTRRCEAGPWAILYKGKSFPFGDTVVLNLK